MITCSRNNVSIEEIIENNKNLLEKHSEQIEEFKKTHMLNKKIKTGDWIKNPRLGGWAPGEYIFTCQICREIIGTGDKRARQCYPCAIEFAYKELQEKVIQYEERICELEYQILGDGLVH